MAAVQRAEKSGIALEAQQKIHGKYDQELAAQILIWVQVCVLHIKLQILYYIYLAFL